MVTLMSSNDPKAEHHKNKQFPRIEAKAPERPNWFRGALWVPVLKREI